MNTLCTQLNFRVNGYPILLDEQFDENALKKHNFRKAGFFDRLMVKVESDTIIWWAKNCELKYLEEKLLGNSIFPILDTKAGAKIMYGTSGYLWYKDNRIARFIFQIIQNKMAAQVSLKKLEEGLNKTPGKTSLVNHPFVSWEIENQKIILEYPKKEHGYIHLVTNE